MSKVMRIPKDVVPILERIKRELGIEHNTEAFRVMMKRIREGKL